MFSDSVVIKVKSGKGGDGMVHMHREKYRPKGGPDGGDGGKGGDVVLRVEPTLNTLSRFHYNENFAAENGRNGGPNKQSGKSADDLIIPVPPGTLVYNDETGELLGDLVLPGQTLVVAKGGRGGRGNQHFASSRNQMPLTAERGEPSEELTLRLELKLIADVGLVGLPNAGKSSFLAATTNAQPKIAEYPFTTLEPNLGVVHLDAEHDLVLADIPGLIEGAHEGSGLGYEFLRHIQRTRVLIHILDGLSNDPYEDYLMVNQELELYDERLGKLPQVVVLNKIDLPDVAERFEPLREKFSQEGVELMPISAVGHTNLDKVLWKAYEYLQQAPEEEPKEEVPVYRAEENPRAFTISREGDAWIVSGKMIEKAAAMTFWEQPGSVRRFQRLLSRMGIDAALKEAGVSDGDTVVIGDYELEWQE
jgi:GTP-binding protein